MPRTSNETASPIEKAWNAVTAAVAKVKSRPDTHNITALTNAVAAYNVAFVADFLGTGAAPEAPAAPAAPEAPEAPATGKGKGK